MDKRIPGLDDLLNYVAENLAHPVPPPGSTEEQLPAEILMLTVLRPYISTACETAHALESAMIRHPEHRTELELWRDRMHGRCRLNNKFTGVLCACPHHTEKQ